MSEDKYRVEADESACGDAYTIVSPKGVGSGRRYGPELALDVCEQLNEAYEAGSARWQSIAKKRRRKLEALKAAHDSLIAAADGLCTTVMLDDRFNELDDEVIEAYDALEGALKAARKVML